MYLRLNQFGNFGFWTGYFEMRCSKSCYLCDLELVDLFDVVEQVVFFRNNFLIDWTAVFGCFASMPLRSAAAPPKFFATAQYVLSIYRHLPVVHNRFLLAFRQCSYHDVRRAAVNPEYRKRTAILCIRSRLRIRNSNTESTVFAVRLSSRTESSSAGLYITAIYSS